MRALVRLVVANSDGSRAGVGWRSALRARALATFARAQATLMRALATLGRGLAGLRPGLVKLGPGLVKLGRGLGPGLAGVGRVLAGWALIAGGALALTGAVSAAVVGTHRSEVGFTASLTPVHTDGHAIVVADIGAMLDRHGLARLFGDGWLTISVASPSTELVAALAPSPEAIGYLDGTAHTEILAVGYAAGAQPVQAVDRPGSWPWKPAPWERESIAATPVAGASVVSVRLPVPVREPTALVVYRPDHAPDFTVTITVGYAPSSWAVVTTVLWLGAALATPAGLALLLIRRSAVDRPPARGRPAGPPAVPKNSSYVYARR